MDLVTNVCFPEGIKIDGVRIPKGMTTQVRVDFGCGVMNISRNGQIEHVHVYPPMLHGKDEIEYNQLLKKFTGIMSSNMGEFFVKNGQIMYLDITANLGHDGWMHPHWNELTKDIDVDVNFKDYELMASMSVTDFNTLEHRLLALREILPKSDVTIEIVDPFHTESKKKTRI